MIRLCCSVFALSLAAACASQPAPTTLAANQGPNKGMVTVAGVSSARVLGAIDTSKLVKNSDIARAGDPPSAATNANGDEGITVNGVDPAAVLAAIDTSKLVGPDRNAKQPAKSSKPKN